MTESIGLSDSLSHESPFPWFNWETLPPLPRALLLQGGVGSLHVHEAAHALFQAVNDAPNPEERERLYALGCDVLQSAWETMPLEPTFAATLLTLQERTPFLSPSLAGLLRFLARQPVPQGPEAERLDLAHVRHLERWQSAVRQAARQGSFFALGQAVSTGLRENLLPWLSRLLEDDQALPRPLKKGFLADTAFAAQHFTHAAQLYAEAYALLPLEVWRAREAESHYRSGNSPEATSLWFKAVIRRPWSVNLTHRLADVLTGRDKPGAFPPGRGAVLLYSWNKADDIDATLASVAQSELEADYGEARLYVLDNGSTDSTPFVLERWNRHFQGRMTTITLPVNVGAPAARNWLLSLPEVKASPWAAFLDDDVAVPRHWLRQLWDGVRHFPQAGVVSGHAVDYEAPVSQQWTDMHIVPLPCPDNQPHRVFRDRFRFTSLHEQALDFGDYRFMRPCVTVIGCCHLFTRRAMDEGGTFDVRFSPSQSDDVDHDMRRGLAGHLPVGNAHLEIRHKRTTGYHKTPNPRSWASAVGNWYKLQGSYTDSDVQKLYALDQRLMLEGVVCCRNEIASAMSQPHAQPVKPLPRQVVQPLQEEYFPLVGVVVPAYNYAHYLPETLNSLLSQEGVRLTVVVVDDGSTDDTPLVLAQYSGQVHAVRQPNAGLSGARNTGMATLFAEWDKRGEADAFLAFLDADDLLPPGVLASQARELVRTGGDLVVCQNRLVCGDPGQPFSPAPIPPWPLFAHHLEAHLCQFNIAPPHAWLLRRQLAEAVGPFDTSLRACEDHDFWLRACALGAHPLRNDNACVLYRKHAQSMSAQSENQNRHDALLHARVATLLHNPGLFAPCRLEAWLAHAAGCLVTSIRLFTIDPADSHALLLRARHGLKALAAELALKKLQRTPSPTLDVVRDFYALRVLDHAEALVTHGSLPDREVAEDIRTILLRLVPHAPQLARQQEALFRANYL